MAVDRWSTRTKFFNLLFFRMLDDNTSQCASYGRLASGAGNREYGVARILNPIPKSNTECIGHSRETCF